MKKRIIAIILCLCMISPSTFVFAADEGVKEYTYEEINQLKDTLGTKITPDDWYKNTRIQGNGSGKVVDVEGEEFDKAYHINVKERGDTVYSTQAWIDFDATGLIKTGDTIFMTYKVRPIESHDETGNIRLAAKLRPSGDNKNVYQITSNFAHPATVGWISGYAIKKATIDGTNKATVCVQVGQAKQTLELADFQIYNLGSNIDESQFPSKKTTWLGMEEDAQWRKNAQERIEQIRKAEVEVNVTDASGNVIPNAEVKINQKEHAFRHGATLPVAYFDKENEKEVFEQFRSMFNHTGFSFWLKARYIESKKDVLERAFKWIEENNVTCRGHVYVWKPDFIQTDVVDKVMSDKDAMKQYIREHIAKYGERYKGKISTWDVANEQVTNPEIWKVTGKEDMIEWFRAAKAADPYAKTALTDYGILGTDFTHRDAHYELVKYLIDNGAPIDVAGIQGHISNSANPQTVLNALNKFAALGLDIEITEFTASISDEKLQGQFVRDMLITFFSHPAVDSVMVWNYIASTTDEDKMKALVKPDLTLKPAGEAWVDLFYNQWWTKESGKTDASGKYMTRAFFGDQEITVTANGKTSSVVVPVDFKGAKVTAVVGDDISFNEATVYDATRVQPDKKTRIVTNTGFDDSPNAAPTKIPSDIEFHWAKEYIERLIAKNIINGYADGTFKPENHINIDEFIKLCVAAKGTIVENAQGYWADSWINKAIELGYFVNGNFDSYQRPITREEMAYIVANAVGSLGDSDGDKTLTDIGNCSQKFAEGVKKAVSFGIITGYEDGSFRPNNNAKRAEAVVVIERMLNIK